MDKDKAKYQTVDEYIKAFPKDVQGVLKKMRQTIKEAAPGAIETISYQIPTFKLNGKGLVYFAAFQSHIGFYPIHAGVEGFEKELSQYKQGKGSVQFPARSADSIRPREKDHEISGRRNRGEETLARRVPGLPRLIRRIGRGRPGDRSGPRDAPAESDCPALHLSPDDEAQRLEASPTPG